MVFISYNGEEKWRGKNRSSHQFLHPLPQKEVGPTTLFKWSHHHWTDEGVVYTRWSWVKRGLDLLEMISVRTWIHNTNQDHEFESHHCERFSSLTPIAQKKPFDPPKRPKLSLLWFLIEFVHWRIYTNRSWVKSGLRAADALISYDHSQDCIPRILNFRF